MANAYLVEASKNVTNLLPIKLRLFIGMMIAAHTAALAIYFYVLLVLDNVELLGLSRHILAFRVLHYG